MIPAHHPDPQHHAATTPPAGESRRHRAAAPYGRADAIADGLLIEVPARLSRQFHFTYPLAVSAQVWADAIAWDSPAEQGKPTRTGQHESTRITEVLWAARQALYMNRTGSSTVRFVVLRVPPVGPETRSLRVTLEISLYAGDCGETVATIRHAHATGEAAAWVVINGRAFPAVAVQTDSTGRAFPVVTVDVLDEVLSRLAGLGIDTTPGEGGAVHVHHHDGLSVTLRPDAHEHYPLQPLAWFTELAVTPTA